MKKKDLKDLIRHCAIHSGYQNCGYLQMTTEQKALYDRINKRSTPELYASMDEDQQRRYNAVRGDHVSSDVRDRDRGRD